MNKKHTLKRAAAVFMGLALTVGAAGCNLITTNSQRDLEREVANVNITDSKKNEIHKNLKDVLQYLSTDIKKSELVSSYLSTGYQYVEQYGLSYEQTFNMLLDSLVSREIMIQYAVNYFLTNGVDGVAKDWTSFEAGLKDTEYKEVAVLKYFLTEENYDKAVYSLKKSLNSSLDSMEASYVTVSEEEHDHEEARTLPTGVDTEKEDYYTTNYEVYTGRNHATDCGEYETIDGSTRSSRQKAYNAFLSNIQAYNLIGKKENTQDVTKLSYYYLELASVLGQALINQYFEAMEEKVSGKLDEAYVSNKYAETKAQQEKDYDDAGLASAMDSAAEGSYILHGLEGYGYVYNILIPFSATQNVKYSEAKNRKLGENALFATRNNLAKAIEVKDLRESWISEHDHANYSYVGEDEKTYFFQDNFAENAKYEALSHYAGNYAYTEEKTDIDGFIDIFNNYVAATANTTVTGEKNDAFYTTVDFSADEKMAYNDYENFVYYKGKVQLDDVSAAKYFVKDSQQYKALSAVNELLFAYGTDPGAFNSYMGYKVSPEEGSTGFVKEFEYAAQWAVNNGVGSYAVCVTDYGWHILYCSFAFDGGDVYGGYVEAEKDVEGTFSNLYYETMKEAAFSNYATEEQNRVIREYNLDDVVERFEENYKDLLEM